MLEPLSASLFRKGACLLPITLERCLFSKITITMWSGVGADAFDFFEEGGGGVDVDLYGENESSTTFSCCGEGCTAAPVPFGCAGTTVAGLLERTGGAVGGGPVAPQASHVSITIPMTAQAEDGKARTWNPLLIQVLANSH
jgi:hypothetical protein